MPIPSTADVVVLGTGVAGLTCAIHAARSGLSVLVFTKSELGQSATRYAQGGVAAALESHDSPELHLSDTFGAGGALCDAEAVGVLVREGPARLRELVEMGAVFDRTGDGVAAGLALAREGGHSVARVVHAGGDATGAEIGRALTATLLASGVQVHERWFAIDLLVQEGRCTGVLALDPYGEIVELRARHVVLASGGAGQLFSVTTNPEESTGDGVAMALRAGVATADLELVQFHPTALYSPVSPRPLLSEALRGEGAVLRDEQGIAFMEGEHPLGDLAPRDVVARGIARRMAERGLDHVWLDATSIKGFEARFPTIWRSCREINLDPSVDLLPVGPAAHYLCGGVVTDLDGASALPGLWAAGEVACTGVNGANRLASNSLLEGLVFGRRAGEAIARGKFEPDPTGALCPLLPSLSALLPLHESGSPAFHDETRPQADPQKAGSREREVRSSVQDVMSRHVGVVRDADGLNEAQRVIVQARKDAASVEPHANVPSYELQNLITVGNAVVSAALAREESRGCHTRSDFPATDDRFVGRFVHAGGRAPFIARFEREREASR